MVYVRFEKLGVPTVVKGPLPSLQLRTLPRVSNEGLSEAQAKDPGPILIQVHASATIQGIPIDSVSLASGMAAAQPLSFFGQREALWNLRLPRYVLEAVEESRQNDVNVVLTVEFLCWLPNTPENRFPWQWTNAQYIEEIPQSRWLTLLEDLGFSGGWLIELSKPRTKGMDTVQKYLVEADGLLGTHNPKGALLACRQAWATLESILVPVEPDVSKLIDGLSRGEEKRPSKSKRIEEIREAIEALTQIGPHEEAYEVSMDDALTAYRLTVSLTAFYSKKIHEAEGLRTSAKSG